MIWTDEAQLQVELKPFFDNPHHAVPDKYAEHICDLLSYHEVFFHPTFFSSFSKSEVAAPVNSRRWHSSSKKTGSKMDGGNVLYVLWLTHNSRNLLR